MRPSRQANLAIMCLLVHAALQAAAIAAGPGAEVTIVTADGRELAGLIDPRTDEAELWLRREGPGFSLAASVSWNEVVSARLEDHQLDPVALRERGGQLAAAAGRVSFSDLAPSLRQSQLTPLVNETSSTVAAGRPPRVRSLEIISASLVNLDRDVEPDGVAVALSPIGAHGIPMAVRGALRATLTGQRRDNRTGAMDFGELGRWSQPVRPEDFVDGVATYDLRFRTNAIAWDFQLMPDALVTVELSAAGHGSYSASAPIALRKFNPLRDQLQLFRGSRFAPPEDHGTQPLAPFGSQQGLWQFWAR